MANEEIDKIMKINLSICDKYMEDYKDIENEEIQKKIRIIKYRLKELENLKRGVQRRRIQAHDYLKKRKKNESFKKLAYTECFKYINKTYINQIKCFTKPLFFYNRELLKAERQKRKLGLED